MDEQTANGYVLMNWKESSLSIWAVSKLTGSCEYVEWLFCTGQPTTNTNLLKMKPLNAWITACITLLPMMRVFSQGRDF